MIAKGLITKRANQDQVSAQTIERDYVLVHMCAEIGARNEPRLVFKGGTFLRLCCFENYRYSADLDFSAIEGLSRRQALDLVAAAAVTCRERLEMPELEVTGGDGSSSTAAITYVGPLYAKSRRLKLDISENELVENHQRVKLHRLWPDVPDGSAIEGYTMAEIGAEKLRCVAERVQCRDLFDLDELLDGPLDPLQIWALYLRKTENDRMNSTQRTPPQKWAARFEERLTIYRTKWQQELSDFVGEPPRFEEVERRIRKRLAEVLAEAASLSDGSTLT